MCTLYCSIQLDHSFYILGFKILNSNYYTLNEITTLIIFKLEKNKE